MNDWNETARAVERVIRGVKRGEMPDAMLAAAEQWLDEMQTALLEMRDHVELARDEKAGGYSNGHH